MLLSLEKKVLRNQEMRIKFPDLPEKFMESELELNDELQKLHIIATVPEYYPVLVETRVLVTLLGLLGHDNTDISLTVVDLLQELTDVDTLSENQEEAEGLVDALLVEQVLSVHCVQYPYPHSQVIALLVTNLERLDERSKEEGEGVYNSLSILENMCEVRNNEVMLAAGEQGLLVWLLKRVRIRSYDPNKLYASEILAIMLQGHETNQRLLGEKDGIDVLLQALAYYKRRDPGGLDEIELMENLFDCLCAALMFSPNRERFLKGEGLQLMILMLKEKKMSGNSALKVLNYSLSTPKGADNCNKFVEVYGLRSLFPCFMKTPKKSKKVGTSKSEHEEHVCSIVAALFQNVTTGAGRERLIGKFLERDHEKVERLVELHFSYSRRLKEVSVGGEDEEDVYLARLDAGLYTLQMVDYVLAELCLCEKGSIRERVVTLLGVHGESLEAIQQVLREYAVSLGDADTTKTLNQLADKLLP